MMQRLKNYHMLAPESIKAMYALEASFAASSIEHRVKELVKLRASQINGCAFCIHMHTTDLRNSGESEMRLYMLNAWRESSLYGDRERAALGWTEALTRIADTHAPDADYEAIKAEFTDEEQADDITLTLMLALERLSPLERAAFLLHDVFGVALNDVASTLDRDAAAVRQLAVRARRHVRTARPRFRLEEAEADRIVHAFFAAARDGDIKALGSMLAQNVVVRSDGGGRVLAFLNPIVGVAKALRLFAGLARKHTYQPVLLRRVSIDGLPGYGNATVGRHGFIALSRPVSA